VAAPPPAAPPPLALSVAAPGRAPYVPPRKVLRVDSKGQATYVLVESERERERERETEKRRRRRRIEKRERVFGFFALTEILSSFLSLTSSPSLSPSPLYRHSG